MKAPATRLLKLFLACAKMFARRFAWKIYEHFTPARHAFVQPKITLSIENTPILLTCRRTVPQAQQTCKSSGLLRSLRFLLCLLEGLLKREDYSICPYVERVFELCSAVDSSDRVWLHCTWIHDDHVSVGRKARDHHYVASTARDWRPS